MGGGWKGGGHPRSRGVYRLNAAAAGPALLKSGASARGTPIPACLPQLRVPTPPHPRGRATAGVAVSARQKSLERSPDPPPQPLCISDFGAVPSPTSPCPFAPRFFMRFSRVLQPSIFASLFVLLLGGLGSEAAFAPLPLFILPCSDNPPFHCSGGGLGSVHPTPRRQHPATCGPAPRNLQQLHI